jgi:hypothetical protein
MDALPKECQEFLRLHHEVKVAREKLKVQQAKIHALETRFILPFLEKQTKHKLDLQITDQRYIAIFGNPTQLRMRRQSQRDPLGSKRLLALLLDYFKTRFQPDECVALAQEASNFIKNHTERPPKWQVIASYPKTEEEKKNPKDDDDEDDEDA